VLMTSPAAASSSMRLHLREKRRRRHLKLLCVCQGDPKVRDLGLALRGKRLLYSLPDTGSMLDPLNMRKNLRGERLEEI
jgi:hypothetical protein